MSADMDRLCETNWDRMRESIQRAATEWRRTADALEAIPFDNAKGQRRAPEAIISQVSLSMDTDAGALLIHRLATWAETINEIDRRNHDVSHMGSRSLCPYSITDPDTRCVLTAGHSLPTDDGLPVHVDADGVMFA